MHGIRSDASAAEYFLACLVELGWDECPRCEGVGEIEGPDRCQPSDDETSRCYHHVIVTCPDCKGYGACQMKATEDTVDVVVANAPF